MPTYEEIKAELLEISKLLEKLPEQIRSQAYDLLISEFLGEAPGGSTKSTRKRHARSNKKAASEGTATTEKPVRRTGTAGKESYSIDRNLDLRGDKSVPSFSAFHSEKAPRNAKEFNAVAVYYLQKILGLPQITLDMVYTCYAEAHQKPPEAFRQSFIDTKNREGWVEFDENGYLKVPHRGSVFVEHDLPPAKPGSKKEKK